MTYKIGLTYTFSFTIHDAVGVLSDADALPTADVFEDDGDVSVDAPTIEKIGAFTGYYRVIVYLDPAIYTADSSYNVIVAATVGGTDMAVRVTNFAAETANQTDILTKLNELIVTPGGLMNYENPWVVGNLPAGGTVAIRVFDSTGVEEVLTVNTCTEFISGYYRWSTSNMSVYPSSVGSYMWIMTDSVSGRTTWGITPIGTPEDLGEVAADGVWDALTADHNDADTFGRFVQGIPTAAENRQEMDSNSIQLGQIRTNTDRVDGLIEDDGSGNDRLTEKALEEAPGTSLGDIETGCGNALTAYDAATGADVTVVEGKVDDIYVDTQRVDGLAEDIENLQATADSIETKATAIQSKTDTIDWADVDFIKAIEGGRWKIESNQMVFYDSDNITEVARFDLKNKQGVAADTDVFERTRVT